MIKLTDIDIIQEPELELGTKFWQNYKGLTMTGFGNVNKCWQVEEYLMNGYFSCRLAGSNTVASINPNYKKTFHINEINCYLK